MAMPDDHFPRAREHILGSFAGPGIDPPSLDDSDTAYGWVSQEKDFTPERVVSAAVLIPLVDRPDGMTVLLTQRTPHLKSHGGQVSFPGGKTEDHDDTAEDTALRESEEEIGLSRLHVDLVGRLGQRTTGSGFQVTPVVGLIQPHATFEPDPGEVETIFEVPLSFVLDAGNHKIETRLIQGIERRFYAMPYDDFYIWGLTARLLVALRNTLNGS
jgi:8-oxo-dGTP pyrophosphatase MutT (NUDIX family)